MPFRKGLLASFGQSNHPDQICYILPVFILHVTVSSALFLAQMLDPRSPQKRTRVAQEHRRERPPSRERPKDDRSCVFWRVCNISVRSISLDLPLLQTALCNKQITFILADAVFWYHVPFCILSTYKNENKPSIPFKPPFTALSIIYGDRMPQCDSASSGGSFFTLFAVPLLVVHLQAS